MSAILNFPRAQRVVADLSPDALLRRCRLAARVAGCNSVHIATVEHAAKIQLKAGGKPVSILTQARSLAKQLATHPKVSE
jgi:hypothetical protein